MPEWLPDRDVETEDDVFKPQSKFLLIRAGILWIKHVARLEDPGSYMTFLEGALGHCIEVKHLNCTGDIKNFREKYIPEMRDIIHNKYRRDFELKDFVF